MTLSQSTINPNAELERFSSNAFLHINKNLIKCFGLECAAYIANLVDHYAFFKRKRKLENGEFFLTHEKQVNQLGISERRLRKHKETIRKLGIIITQRRGIPAKEWYVLDLRRLNEYVDQWEEKNGRSSPSKSVRTRSAKGVTNIITRTNFNENKKDIPKGISQKNALPSSPKEKTKESFQEYIPLASHLSNTIQSNKNIVHTKSQVERWAREIRPLITSNKISVPRIKKALVWYRKHIGEDFVPVIESGRSLRDKFLKLEAAIQRENNRHNNQGKYGVYSTGGSRESGAETVEYPTFD